MVQLTSRLSGTGFININPLITMLVHSNRHVLFLPKPHHTISDDYLRQFVEQFTLAEPSNIFISAAKSFLCECLLPPQSQLQMTSV